MVYDHIPRFTRKIEKKTGKMNWSIQLCFVTTLRHPTMYYSYVFGCNKYEPKLLFASMNLESLQQKLIDTVFGGETLGTKHSFLELLDVKKMGEENIIMNGSSEDGEVAGPAKDYCETGGLDWYITKQTYTKLYAYRGVDARCTCSCRLSIFCLHSDINFRDVENAIYEFII